MPTCRSNRPVLALGEWLDALEQHAASLDGSVHQVPRLRLGVHRTVPRWDPRSALRGSGMRLAEAVDDTGIAGRLSE